MNKIFPPPYGTSFPLAMPDSQGTSPKEMLHDPSPDARQKSNLYATRQAAAVGNLFFGLDGRESDQTDQQYK